MAACSSPSSACTFFLLVIIGVLACAPSLSQAILDCGAIVDGIKPCEEYLETGHPAPNANQCCNGVRDIIGSAVTVADQQIVCKCLTQHIISIRPQLQFLFALPRACNVNIGPYANCNNIR